MKVFCIVLEVTVNINSHQQHMAMIKQEYFEFGQVSKTMIVNFEFYNISN
jgi:hypothetical protein